MTKFTRFFLSSIVLTIFLTAAANAQQFGGEAAAAKASVEVVGQPLLTTAVAHVGPLAPTGGTSTLAGAAANIPNIGSIGASTVSISGTGLVSQSQAGVNGININLLSGTVTLGATAIASNANCNCPTTSCAGSSSITGLTLNGVAVTVLGTPNQIVDVFVAGVKVGELIIN